jgi:hypothetical protein
MSEHLVRESVVEAYLLSSLKALGVRYPQYRSIVKKISGPGWRGWTDRLALFNDFGGCAHWLELKRPKGGQFEPLQLRCHQKLRDMGFVVRVLNTKAQIDEYISEIERLGPRHLPAR